MPEQSSQVSPASHLLPQGDTVCYILTFKAVQLMQAVFMVVLVC